MAPEKRIDVAFLDSVIRTEIANDDLPKTYHFMVANEFGIPIKFAQAPETYDTELDTLLTGKTALFPSNILDENFYLTNDEMVNNNSIINEKIGKSISEFFNGYYYFSYFRHLIFTLSL
jgi:hypothetical protein